MISTPPYQHHYPSATSTTITYLSLVMLMGSHHHTLRRLFALLLLLLAPPLAVAEIKNVRIVADFRPTILFEQFGFTSGGRVSVSVDAVSWTPIAVAGAIDSVHMGFVLVRDTLFPKIINESEYSPRFCPLSSRFAKPVLTFRDLGAGLRLNSTTAIDEPDEYSLLFCNCRTGAAVNMNVRTEMYNMEADGTRDYLPAGMTQLPKIYFGFFVVYAVFLVVWAGLCVRRRVDVERIHLVMAALLLFKALKLVCAAEDLWHVKTTGSPHGWDVAFYVFGFFKGVLLFTVIVLIGTGWSFLKPYLQEREKNVLMIVIPLQVIENIATVMIGEMGPAEKDWFAWNQIFLLVDILCCCAVFLPIIWSIKNLREASKTDGKAARNLEKLTLFKQFYFVVVCYLYFTRIVASAFGAVLNYRYAWLVTAMVEGASLAFYLFVFHNFQPVERNPYLYIGNEEEEAAAEVLEMESFEL